MSDLMKLIQDADTAAIEFEKARAQVDIAKQNLDSAKELHDQARGFLDEIVSRADDLGFPRAKVKKLIEERTQALLASGLMPSGVDVKPSLPKERRAPKKARPAPDIPVDDFASRPANEASIMELN